MAWILIGNIRGPNGIAGADGEDGKSAYQVALDDGFAGSESEWLESLVGPKGEPGADGASVQGPPGVDGSDGRDGADGHSPVITWDDSTIVVDGTPGPDLLGPPGVDGQDGAPGDKGDPGPPGVVQSLVGGTNVTIDDSDPAHPVINATGGGGGGLPNTGVVELDPHAILANFADWWTINIQRQGDAVYLNVSMGFTEAIDVRLSSSGAALVEIPPGFAPAAEAAYPPGAAGADGARDPAVFAVGDTGGGTPGLALLTGAPSQDSLFVSAVWLTDDPWPEP